jgi:nucleotide-binding universal stress UspA family protein
MYRNIIIGYDGSPQSEDALALAKLISDATGAELTLAGVFYFSRRLGGRDPVLRDVEADHIRQLEEAADSMGASAEAIASTSAAHGLHSLAERIDADLVVVGSARHGKAGQILAGNVGMALLHGSPCSIAIAPQGYADRAPSQIKELAVGFDGSPESAMALQDAFDLARASGAKVRLVTVAEPPPIVYGKSGGPDYSWHALKEDLKAVMRERLDAALASAPDDLQVEGSLLEGHAETALPDAAGEGALLVLGSRAYGPMRRVLLGSVSTPILRSAPCPVIVHPRPAKAKETDERSAEPAGAASGSSG